MQNYDEKVKTLHIKTVIIWCIVLFLVPATIGFGIVFLDDRKYYIIGLLIILFTLMAFFLSFENRKPSARELSILAVLCAVGAVGRGLFFMLPQFKPLAAVIILAAVCLGPTSGFLVGAISAFVSNIFFGQGNWTPWQMFAFGMIGFLSGVFFQKGILPTKKLPICIFGGVSIIVIYGGIIDLSAVLMGVAKVNAGTVLAAYATGFISNLIHASATVLFLFLFTNPMVQILTRIKTKYGLFL